MPMMIMYYWKVFNEEANDERKIFNDDEAMISMMCVCQWWQW